MDHMDSHVTQAALQEWQRVRMHALEGVPLPFGWLIVIFVIVGGAWAALSTYLRQAVTGIWDTADLRTGVVTVAVCVAILLYLRTLKRVTVEALCELRPVVPIAAEDYERLGQRMLAPQWWAELLLLAVSAALFVLLFVVLPPNEMLGYPRRTVLDWGGLTFLSAFGCLAIWIVLTLVYCGLRSSLALRALAQNPLIVNAFDPTPLLPFGRLGALHSLGFVGMMLIPLAILGAPRAAGGYAVLALSLVSLAVLFVPLWGVHRQIVRARERVLHAIAADLFEVQTRLLSDAGRDAVGAGLLYEHAQRLTGLRGSVLSTPSWPFRDNGAVARLVTALFLPTLVAVISYALQRFVFPLFGRTP